MRPLTELSGISIYDMTASEIEFLRQNDAAAYKVATDTIDTEAAKQLADVGTVQFRNGRRVEAEPKV